MTRDDMIAAVKRMNNEQFDELLSDSEFNHSYQLFEDSYLDKDNDVIDAIDKYFPFDADTKSYDYILGWLDANEDKYLEYVVRDLLDQADTYEDGDTDVKAVIAFLFNYALDIIDTV